MTGTRATEKAGPGREQTRAAMLEAALARPGVREFMDVYHSWQELDRGLDPYRLATKRPEQITTTDHANTE